MSEFRVTIVGDPHIEAAGGYDGSDLAVPAADLIIVLGDWVRIGTDAEYEAAEAWARGLPSPHILVRGNHDNGSWHRAARRVCPPSVTAQLAAHSPVEQMRVVEWRPMVWERVNDVAFYFPRERIGNCFPATGRR